MIAVFASGRGSNFYHLVQWSRSRGWKKPVSLLFCDQPQAEVIQRAQNLKVPSVCFSLKEYTSKIAYERHILSLLCEKNIEWILLAGYMKIIGPTLLQAYEKRIINIHPSLLPAFPGKDAIEKAFNYPVKVSGITIHYVDEGIDTGPIIAQCPVWLDENDTLTSFKEKIHQAEHQFYSSVVERLILAQEAFYVRRDFC
jgi:phosphoribosylglycinamide formyltransferase 1